MIPHFIVRISPIIGEFYSRQSRTRMFSRSAWKLAWNASTWVLIEHV